MNGLLSAVEEEAAYREMEKWDVQNKLDLLEAEIIVKHLYDRGIPIDYIEHRYQDFQHTGDGGVEVVPEETEDI